MKGIYLVEPHGYWIYEGKKKAIIKSRDFSKAVEDWLVLVEDGLAYGYIKLSKPKKITYSEFKRLKDKHLVLEEEAESWWGKDWKDSLYLYEIESFIPFDTPKKIDVPLGVQTFIRDVEQYIKGDLPKEPAIKEFEDYGRWKYEAKNVKIALRTLFKEADMLRIRSSILDYVKKSLDPDVWDDNGNLRPDIKEQILTTLYDVIASLGFSPEDIVKDVLIVGSLTTRQYLPWSDMDVLVLLDDSIREGVLNKIAGYFKFYINGMQAIGTSHPINFHFERESRFDKRQYYGVYDVVDNEWILKEEFEGYFDPEEVFKTERQSAEEIANSIIMVMEELVRDLMDFREVQKLRDVYAGVYEKKMKEIFADVVWLVKMLNKIENDRMQAYKGSERPERSMANVIYKYLERYGYLSRLHSIRGAFKSFIDTLYFSL